MPRTRLGKRLQHDCDSGKTTLQWATASSRGRRMSMCLWGDRQLAVEGRDPDEVLVLVRVSIVKVEE